MADELRREVQVDTALAALNGRLHAVYAKLESVKKSLAQSADLKGEWGRGAERRTLTYHHYTLDEVVEAAQANLDNVPRYDRERVERLLAEIPVLLAERDEIRAEMKPLDAEYAANPWSRFFLVTSSAGGHIHASTGCSTTRIRTGFAWLPELSGLTEKDAVDAHGPLLCSVCYPTAPVEWTKGPEKKDDDMCPGSRTARIVMDTFRRTSYTGSGRAKCECCGEFQPVTASGVFRKHNKAKVEAKS